jgi:hypothetical protein
LCEQRIEVNTCRLKVQPVEDLLVAMGKKPKGKGKKGGKAAAEEEAQKKAAAAAAAKKKAAEEEAQRAKQEEAERAAEAKRKAEEGGQQQQQEEEEEEEEEEAQTTAEGAAGDDERAAVYEAMRPMQLKDECRKRGLPPEGLKEELIERLLDYGTLLPAVPSTVSLLAAR